MGSKVKHSANVKGIEMADYGRELENVKTQLRNVQDQLKTMQTANSFVTAETGDIFDRFADQVTVVGLKEAVTNRRRILKTIWMVLLALGLAATVYYIYKNTDEYLKHEIVTKITLERKDHYSYPPVILCPPWWFDYETVHSLNLSDDGLKYSLFYSNLLQDYKYPDLANLTKGKTDFLDFYYKKQKHTNLIQYYGNISANVTYDEQEDEIISVRCIGCNKSTPITKVIVSNAICYKFFFEPADISNERVQLKIRNKNRSNGILQMKNENFWRFDLYPNIRQTYGASMELATPKSSFLVTVYTQKYKQLQPCNTSESNQGDFIDKCIKEKFYKTNESRPFLRNTSRPNDTVNYAKHKHFNEQKNVSWPESIEEQLFSHNILQFSNFTDWRKNRISKNNSFNDGNLYETRNYSDAQRACYQEFLQPCNRKIFHVSVDRNDKVGSEGPDESVLSIGFENAAVLDGGVTFLEEVETMSFTEFIANLGGTLGLFLGCTIMTLPQLVLSVINYIMDLKCFKRCWQSIVKKNAQCRTCCRRKQNVGSTSVV